MLRCDLHHCKEGQYHFHCCYCTKTYRRKQALKDHLCTASCKKETVSSRDKIRCSECGQEVVKKNMKVHVQRKHNKSKKFLDHTSFYPGICVDERQGIYMVSKSRQGQIQPIHVQKHTTDPNCQKLACNQRLCMDLTSIAHRAGKASYECPHLLSISKTQNSKRM